MARALRRAVRLELQPGGLFHTARNDAAEGVRFFNALQTAWAGLSRAARRGVSRVLDPARRAILGAAAPPGGQEGWVARTTSAVARAVGRAQGRGAAPRVVERAGGSTATAAVIEEHAHHVKAASVAAGVPRYVWSTQLDERVRPLHVKLEGTVQRWDDPPLAGLPNFHGHPGEAAGPCRCFAYPFA